MCGAEIYASLHAFSPTLKCFLYVIVFLMTSIFKLLLLLSEPPSVVVKLLYCSEDSDHNLDSTPGSGSQLEVDSSSHPSKVVKLSTQLARGEGRLAFINLQCKLPKECFKHLS